MATFRQRGDTWQAIVRIKRGGVLAHTEAKSFTGPSAERLARAWAERVEKDIKNNGTSARKMRNLTVKDLIDGVRKIRNEAKPLTHRRITEYEYLDFMFGKWNLVEDELTAARATAWARKRAEEGAAPATILHNLASLRAVFNAAKPLLGINVNGDFLSESITALEKVGMVGKSQERDRRCSPEEEAALVQEFTRTSTYPHTEVPMHLIVPFAIRFPRRREELMTMKWSDWDPSTGIMTLHDTKDPRRKNRVERVPMPASAREFMKGFPKVDACVLPYRLDSVSAAFARVCLRLGIENLRFHDLRHEGISRLFEQGLGVQEVALISGHLSWRTLQRYTHIKPEDVARKAA